MTVDQRKIARELILVLLTVTFASWPIMTEVPADLTLITIIWYLQSYITSQGEWSTTDNNGSYGNNIKNNTWLH